MADYSTDISADDTNFFASQKRRIDENYGLGTAQNDWQRATAGNDYGRALGDLKTQYGAVRDQLPSAYARGGLLNSGIYARGLDQYQATKTQAMGNLAGSYNDRLAGLSLADQQLETIRRGGLSDVDAAATARRATVAEALKSVGV